MAAGAISRSGAEIECSIGPPYAAQLITRARARPRTTAPAGSLTPYPAQLTYAADGASEGIRAINTTAHSTTVSWS
jgi:hypothetical protein